MHIGQLLIATDARLNFKKYQFPTEQLSRWPDL